MSLFCYLGLPIELPRQDDACSHHLESEDPCPRLCHLIPPTVMTERNKAIHHHVRNNN